MSRRSARATTPAPSAPPAEKYLSVSAEQIALYRRALEEVQRAENITRTILSTIMAGGGVQRAHVIRVEDSPPRLVYLVPPPMPESEAKE